MIRFENPIGIVLIGFWVTISWAKRQCWLELNARARAHTHIIQLRSVRPSSLSQRPSIDLLIVSVPIKQTPQSAMAKTHPFVTISFKQIIRGYFVKHRLLHLSNEINTPTRCDQAKRRGNKCRNKNRASSGNGKWKMNVEKMVQDSRRAAARDRERNRLMAKLPKMGWKRTKWRTGTSE